MKILYFCPEYYYRHGGRTHARGFFGALQGLSITSDCYLYPKEDSRDTPVSDASKRPSRGKLWFLPSKVRLIVQFFIPRRGLTRALVDEIKEHDCDVLVIRTGSRLPILGNIKKACPHTSICLEINSAYFDELRYGLPFRSFFKRWEVKRFHHADAFSVVSSYLKTYLEKYGVPSDSILINHNGVDTGRLNISASVDAREKLGISKDAFVIGYIGGMEPFRRLPEVVSYIADFRDSGNDDVCFIIVGDGEDRVAVEEAVFAQRNSLEGAVKLTGWLEHSEAIAYLSVFDIAIFPFTNSYCSPLKLFEYLAAGLPTIGPDTTAVREVFEHGVHLMLVKQDGSDLISMVKELKNDPDLRSKLGRNGRKLVLSDYTWKKNAERLLGHVQKISAKSNRMGK